MKFRLVATYGTVECCKEYLQILKPYYEIEELCINKGFETTFGIIDVINIEDLVKIGQLLDTELIITKGGDGNIPSIEIYNDWRE